MPIEIKIGLTHGIRSCEYSNSTVRIPIHVNQYEIVYFNGTKGELGYQLEHFRAKDIEEKELDARLKTFVPPFIASLGVHNVFDNRNPIFYFGFTTSHAIINDVLSEARRVFKEHYEAAGHSFLDISAFLLRKSEISATKEGFKCEHKYDVKTETIKSVLEQVGMDRIDNLLILDDSLDKGTTLNCLMTSLVEQNLLNTDSIVVTEIIYSNAKSPDQTAIDEILRITK